MNGRPSPDWMTERRLRALLGGTGQVHYRLDADASTLHRLLGGENGMGDAGSLEAVIERHVPPEDRPAVRAAVAEAVRTRQPIDIEHRVLHSDGSLRWMRSRAVPLLGPDGAVEEWVGGSEDVTARREARDRLREGEERLRLALGIAGLGTWDWDIETGEVDWSDDHYRMLGYAKGEVTPSYEAWIARVHPEDRAVTEGRLLEARDRESRYEVEFRVVPAEGVVGWCRAQGRFLYGPDGRPRRMIGVMQDVTATKAAESRQRLLLAELQHRVRNSLAVIRSIVRRSAQAATDLEDYVSHLEGRINALARVQAAVVRAPGTGPDLEGLLRDEFQAAAATEGQVSLSGPSLRLTPRAAEMLGLALHELTTNAIKHGALRGPGGRVAVSWSLEDGSPPRLRLRWTEQARRPLAPPGSPGFGTELIERMLAYNLGAEAVTRRGPDGLVCDIALPLDGAET